MHYRKLYEKKTGLTLPNNFEVHHIDQDRKNNNIDNLLALPIKLHKEFHKCWNALYIKQFPISINILSTFQTGAEYNNFVFDRISDYMNIYNIAQMWADYRSHLLYNFPNIHNLCYNHK